MKGIRQLAQHLNLSIGTVSRALNGKPDVNETTRNRVLAAAAELGYVPNQSGRALRRGATNVIGFMMRTGRDITAGGDAFFMTVFDGVQTVLARHHLDLVVLPCSSEEDPDDYLRRVVERGFVDGLIISATRRQDPRIEYLSSRHIPFIALGRSLSDAGHPWFDLDFEAMARTSVDRLAGKGHRRIAMFVTSEDLNLNHLLIENYRSTLHRHGLAFDPQLILTGLPNQAGGYELADRAMSIPDPPTAIIALNEMMTVGLYRGFIDLGLQPGRDIAIIGRNSSHARYLSPRLTGFDLSLRELGVALAEALLARMPTYQAIYPFGTVRRVWPMELMEGGSDALNLRTPLDKAQNASAGL